MTYVGVLLFFLFEYVRPVNYLPALRPLHLGSIIPLATIAASMLRSGKVTNIEVLREPNTRYILIFLGLIGLSVLTADVTLYAYNIFMAVLQMFLIQWVITKELTNRKRITGVLKIMVLVHLLVALLNPQIITSAEVRRYIDSGGFLGDGNDFALSVNIVLPFCLFLLESAKGFRPRLAYAAVSLLLILGIIGTSSRGGTLALGCVAGYLILRSQKKLLMIAVVAAILGLVISVAPPIYFERMQTLKDYETEGSSKGRLMAWRSGIRMAVDHPLLGVGAGHFPVKYGVEYRPPGVGRTEIPWSTAHSIYFVILGELGFPGLALLLLLIGSNLRSNRRLRQEIAGWSTAEGASAARLLTCLSASLIAYATGGAFLTAIYYPHMYVLAGLLTAARRVVREEFAGATPQAAALAGVAAAPSASP